LKRWHAKNPGVFAGRTCSAETREKIRAKLLGRKTGRRYERTAEMNAKQSAAMKGRKPNEKQLAALAAGRHRSRWPLSEDQPR
jgi:hypothetical protein